ncbi:MAG TPA: right-handed parallel beta-helix repeat-containing protein [bacterium]|nr:right-handed parallel beta-helix repeat-containing protein [bacterium]
MELRLLFAPAALVALAGAVVIHVPGDSATIQRGLRGALAGDTVLVAPDTYYERIVWPARDSIVLLGESGADSTVIDGSDSGRVVNMTDASYTNATVLEGFTIAHGLVAIVDDGGAGIKCTGSPVISRNRIVCNKLTEFGYGAGVYASGGPVLSYNLIAWDTIINQGGGGWRYGPGVHCAGSGVFYQNVFEENAALGGAGGFWYGGGLALAGGEPLVFSNLFLNNRVGSTAGGFAYGGGLYIGAGSAYVANNTFFGNRCSTGVTYGGGIYVDQSWTSTIKNNIISGNAAEGIGHMGGGIACYTDTAHQPPVFDYNDVWGNSPDNYYACFPGSNALSLDPLYATGSKGDFYLGCVAAGQDSSSPCIDAGDTLLATAPLRLDSLVHAWTTRTDSVPDAGAIDMGYHYPLEPMVVGLDGRLANASLARLKVRPNPVRLRAAVEYSTVHAGRVEVTVVDVAGRVRAILLDRWQPAGDHSLPLGGRLTPGVYLVTLKSGALRATARCVVAE